MPLVNIMGIIFQIRDDYQNLSNAEYSYNKGLCEDLTEGKFSFLIIHSIRAKPENMRLLNILKQKSTDMQVKQYAVSYIEGTGSFKYTREVIRSLIDRARVMVAELDGGEKKGNDILKILDNMAG